MIIKDFQQWLNAMIEIPLLNGHEVFFRILKTKIYEFTFSEDWTNGIRIEAIRRQDRIRIILANTRMKFRKKRPFYGVTCSHTPYPARAFEIIKYRYLRSKGKIRERAVKITNNYCSASGRKGRLITSGSSLSRPLSIDWQGWDFVCSGMLFPTTNVIYSSAICQKIPGNFQNLWRFCISLWELPPLEFWKSMIRLLYQLTVPH